MRLTRSETGGIVVVVILVAFLLFDAARMPHARKVAAVLETEVLALTPPSGAQVVREVESTVKSSGVVLTKRYRFAGPAVTVIAHFSREFAKNGWAACEGEKAEYCKQDLRASVTVAPATAASGLDVTVDAWWR